jgi:uncharacterized sulfatase
MFAFVGLFVGRATLATNRPNIVWIIGEDTGAELGCYNDRYAFTPNLDRLASQGARFTRAFSHAPVCAPSRSGLISGIYPTSVGTHHMRSKLVSPPPTFTSCLRKAGYYVAWSGKTDFNFDIPRDAFDSMQNWVKRIPEQPFFACINLFSPHESRIRAPKEKFETEIARLTTEERHDPAQAPLPPYYPDTPEVRRDVANYYDLVTAMDYEVGDILNELERQGAADNTIVFFFGDHGRGLPRAKRWVYDSGIHVPLLVRWPRHIKPGTVREELVSLIDFAPSVLSLAGVEIPKAMQGQVFLGPHMAPPRQHVVAARDRMDEAFDRIRAVRDKRYKYIRNFHPELSRAQPIASLEETPTMRVWRRLHAEGRLNGPHSLFFDPTKPAEELYDLDTDPHEIKNLADSPEHQRKLTQLRSTLDQWIAETKDLGAVPEIELIGRGLVKNVVKEYTRRKTIA